MSKHGSSETVVVKAYWCATAMGKVEPEPTSPCRPKQVTPALAMLVEDSWSPSDDEAEVVVETDI